VIRSMAAILVQQGIAILRCRRVMRVCGRITVMRAGELRRRLLRTSGRVFISESTSLLSLLLTPSVGHP
jgi:hypothetical protein